MASREAHEIAAEVVGDVKKRGKPSEKPPNRSLDGLDTIDVTNAELTRERRRIKRATDLDNARVRKELDKQERQQRALQLKALGEELLASGVASREILPKLAQSIIVELGLRLANGEWEIKTAEEATKVAKIWYDILRLESGQATSIQEQRTGSPEDRLSRLEELKQEAKRRVEAGLRAIGDGA